MCNGNDRPYQGKRSASAAVSTAGRVLLCGTTMIALVALFCVPANAQVFQVGGGSSSLFNANGGAVEMHAENSDGWFGIGALGGKLKLGASLSQRWHGSTFTFGDDIIPFRMPTDVFDQSHYFIGRGAGVALTRGRLSLLGFGGVTATGFNSPFFRAASPQDGVGVLFLDFKLSPRLRIFSRNIVSNLQTSISGAEWQPRKWLTASLAGGGGANQRYWASSIKIEKPMVSLEGAYVFAGEQFRRIAVQSPLQSETDRENVLLKFHPNSYFDLSAGRFTILGPVNGTQPSARATVNQFSGNVRAATFRFSASLFQSYILGKRTDGTSLSLGRDFGKRIQADGYLFYSSSARQPTTTSLVGMLREVISPRLSLLETVSDSAGHFSPAVGGQFLSNFVTAGVQYQTVFSPFRIGNPFHQALLVNFQLQPFGSFRAAFGSYVAPDGSVKYTANGQTFLYRDQASQGARQKAGFSKYVIAGQVVDENGHAISGAALWIDGDLVFTNAEGRFLVRDRKARTYRVKVALDEFLLPGSFDVISAPSAVDAVKEGAEIPIMITLRHRANFL